MRAADDFATIRARMKELEQARNPEPPREPHQDTTWVERRLELTRLTREKLREFRRV